MLKLWSCLIRHLHFNVAMNVATRKRSFAAVNLPPDIGQPGILKRKLRNITPVGGWLPVARD